MALSARGGAAVSSPPGAVIPENTVLLSCSCCNQHLPCCWKFCGSKKRGWLLKRRLPLPAQLVSCVHSRRRPLLSGRRCSGFYWDIWITGDPDLSVPVALLIMEPAGVQWSWPPLCPQGVVKGVSFFLDYMTILPLGHICKCHRVGIACRQ